MNKKCSKVEHKETDVISFYQKCGIYMCNKCEKYHEELFKNHQKYNLDKDISEIFTRICKEQNHLNKLMFFCKLMINYVAQNNLLKLKLKIKDSILIVIYA